MTLAASDIDTLLRADGVRLLVFKGPALSSTLYGDAGLRSYGDLDILVPRSQFAQAVRLLEREGYRHLVQSWMALEHFRAGEVTPFHSRTCRPQPISCRQRRTHEPHELDPLRP